jgi:hypothetical protein
MVVPRIQIPPIVEGKTQLCCERLPQRALPAGRVTGPDPLRIIPKEQLECLGPTYAVFSVRHEVEVMPLFREEAKRGLEVPEEPEAAY